MSITMLADAKRAVEQLADLTNAELDEIISDDDRCNALLINLDQTYLKELEDEKEKLIEKNNSIAGQNLSRQPQLIEGREKLQALYSEAEGLMKTIEEKTTELREKGGDITLEVALALLQTAATEMEEESDACAEKFLSRDIEIDEFLEQFAVKRKLMHTRRVKADKLSTIIQRGDPYSGNNSDYINAPPVNINTGYFPGIPTTSNLPYPSGPVHMPMPLADTNYFQSHY